MDNIRVGIIGSGGMAKRNAQSFSQTEGYTLKAIAARNPETGPNLAKAHNVEFVPQWQSLVERDDIDALVISSNNESHGQMVLAGLDTKKHIFCEYPVARHLDELQQIKEKLQSSSTVLRTSHNEPLSASHQALKTQSKQMGNLLSAFFTRLTPGRGARPEALFNLPLSGPPSLFFVYHIYPLVDIFGPVAWVSAGAEYEDLQDNGQYHRFVNTVIAGFKKGGLAQWNWAGGVEILEAEEHRRIILTQGSLVHNDDTWQTSTSQGTQIIPPTDPITKSLVEQFLEDIHQETSWQSDTQVSINAAAVGLAAEKSVNEKSRVQLS
ncbi:MAG: Gfo/Idh/MocA family oxidoreductase [Candidatus Latescibacteria bacterium]|jgi:biliverdin reductase|nr:Gfo/Idh/MocA family oxidoreductase [Candidatus Latescibacterota bacterium]MBT5829877.1 Gfo/Idh/MocA family oxidoreductase [Candidatus Latescibacterota bacterium]